MVRNWPVVRDILNLVDTCITFAILGLSGNSPMKGVPQVNLR